MNTPLTIVARVEAKPDQVDFVKTELQKLIAPTRSELGCIQYDLHQDNNQPEVFLFYENWESRETWQTHLKSDHLNAYREATKDAVANVTTKNEMTRIG